MTRVRPAACSRKTSARSCRVPTMEPITEVPFSTVSKIGTWTVPCAGRATMTSLPPRREPALTAVEGRVVHRQGDRGVRAAVPLEHRADVLRAGVDDDVRAEFRGQLGACRR